MLIQDAFPELSPADRELIKTGICGDCFTEIHGHPSDEVFDTENLSVLIRQVSPKSLPVVKIDADDDNFGRPFVKITLQGQTIYDPDNFPAVGFSLEQMMELSGWNKQWPIEIARKFVIDHERVLEDNVLQTIKATLETLLAQWEGPDPRTLIKEQ